MTAPSVPDAASLRGELDVWIEEAGERIRAIAGGETLCQLGRHGGAPQDAKYEEGRLAAWLEARRLLARTTDPVELRETLDLWIGTWEGRREAHQRRFGSAGGWVAYEEGGLDALRLVRGRL